MNIWRESHLKRFKTKISGDTFEIRRHFSWELFFFVIFVLDFIYLFNFPEKRITAKWKKRHLKARVKDQIIFGLKLFFEWCQCHCLVYLLLGFLKTLKWFFRKLWTWQLVNMSPYFYVQYYFCAKGWELISSATKKFHLTLSIDSTTIRLQPVNTWTHIMYWPKLDYYWQTVYSYIYK